MNNFFYLFCSGLLKYSSLQSESDQIKNKYDKDYQKKYKINIFQGVTFKQRTCAFYQ